MPNDIPKMGQGRAIEVTDTTSVEYQRYDNKATGYANPNLYRFQDKAYPQGTRGWVGIYGTDSYQFIETPSLHDEESTTSEIP